MENENFEKMYNLLKLSTKYNMGFNNYTENGFIKNYEYNKYIHDMYLSKIREPKPLSVIIRTKDIEELKYLKDYSEKVLNILKQDYANENSKRMFTNENLWYELEEDICILVKLDNFNNFNIIDCSILILSLNSINSL